MSRPKFDRYLSLDNRRQVSSQLLLDFKTLLNSDRSQPNRERQGKRTHLLTFKKD